MDRKSMAVGSGFRENEGGVDRKKRLLLFWMILLGSFLIRLIRFGSLPFGVNQDEAMGAVDAWALSLYGTDRFGVRLPVHFAAWQVSQMSVLLSYLMIPFIRIFGFHTWVIRLPMLLASVGGIALVYLVGKRLFGVRFAFVAMALTAVNPWHFMQSRWSIDCNLFPHVFLLAFYLLLRGIDKKRDLYLSMFFFGLTFYCYGIAVYSVTPFLAVFALWGLRKKLFSWGEAFLCVLIFGVVALPEILVLAINLFHWDSIETGWITMSRFPETVRGNDILLLKFSFSQLWQNIRALFASSFLQLPDYWFNTIPAFGPLYHISIPFIAGGTVLLTKDLFGEKDVKAQAHKLALWGFLITGIWVGIITYKVNVNRINIIFYPLILISAYGICRLAERSRKWLTVVGAAYGVCALLFVGAYFTVYPKESAQYYNGEFLEAVQTADQAEYERLYITGNMGWQFNLSMAEILTQYACHIDAQYYQEKTLVTGGRELPPYSERYHYINAKNYDWTGCDREGLYLLQEQDLEAVTVPYQVLWEVGGFRILEII